MLLISNALLVLAGDTITVQYAAVIPMEHSPAAEVFQERMKSMLGKHPNFKDRHTFITRDKKPNSYSAIFDQASELVIPAYDDHDNPFMSQFENPNLEILFFKQRPTLTEDCKYASTPFVRYTWDEVASEKGWFSTTMNPSEIFEPLHMSYSTNSDLTFQQSPEAVFRRELGVSLSILDFSEAFVRVEYDMQPKPTFSLFVLKLGQHIVDISEELAPLDNCGGFTIHLPKISSQ